MKYFYRVLVFSILTLFLYGCQPTTQTEQQSLDNYTQNPFYSYCSNNFYSSTEALRNCIQYCSSNPYSCSNQSGPYPGQYPNQPQDPPHNSGPTNPDLNNPGNPNPPTQPGHVECESRQYPSIITFSGGSKLYAPGMPRLIDFSHNISPHLIDVGEAVDFYRSDNRFKVRFKILPQPKAPVGKEWCYNRKTGVSRRPYDYTKLRFNVSLVGVNSNKTLKTYSKSTSSETFYVDQSFNGSNYTQPGTISVRDDLTWMRSKSKKQSKALSPYMESSLSSAFSYGDSLAKENTISLEGNVNGCTKTYDFSGSKQRHPEGVVLVIHDVESNQDCSSAPCSKFSPITPQTCWKVEVQVFNDDYNVD